MGRRRSRDERRALISSWRESGLSLRAWSKREGIGYQSALRWRKEFERQSVDGADLIPVKVVADRSEPIALEVSLSGGLRVGFRRGFDAGEAARLLRELARC